MELDKHAYDGHTKSMQSHINGGVGKDVTIRKLAEITDKVFGYTGKIEFDSAKPDSAPRKPMRSEQLRNLGRAKVSLLEGLKATYHNYLSEYEKQVTIGGKS